MNDNRERSYRGGCLIAARSVGAMKQLRVSSQLPALVFSRRIPRERKWKKQMLSFKLLNINILVEKYQRWQSFSYDYKRYKPGLDVSWETVVDVGFWRVHINK